MGCKHSLKLIELFRFVIHHPNIVSLNLPCGAIFLDDNTPDIVPEDRIERHFYRINHTIFQRHEYLYRELIVTDENTERYIARFLSTVWSDLVVLSFIRPGDSV